MSENVLCFPAKVLDNLGVPDRFSKDIDKYLFEILKQENLLFLERDKAEVDPSFKQIIPYHVLRFQNRYLVYRRGKKGGENRLHFKLSVGIGGHINDTDLEGVLGFRTYAIGAERELVEEINIKNIFYKMRTLGVLYDDSNEVGQVHFGFVHLYDLESTDEILITDDALDAQGWWTKDDIINNLDEFETWSQITIENLLD